MFQYKATVYNVVDGDTVDCMVDLGFKIYTKQRIRLNGIDTPERGEPGFAEATNRLRDLVGGKEITLITYRASKWGYFLGDLIVDGKLMNTIMVDEGLAKVYTGGSRT